MIGKQQSRGRAFLGVVVMLAASVAGSAEAEMLSVIQQPLTDAVILPPDGAEGVPTNTRILVDRHAPLDAALSAPGPVEVEGVLRTSEGEFWLPALSPDTGYVASVTSFSDQATVDFSTGTEPDETAPTLGGEIELVAVCSLYVDCPGRPAAFPPQSAEAETLLVTLRLPRVVDDSLVIFRPYEGEAPDVLPSPRPIYTLEAITRWAVASSTSPREIALLEVVSDPTETRHFHVVAEDIAGNRSAASNLLEVTLERPMGCSATHVRGSVTPVGLGALLLVAVAHQRTRRTRALLAAEHGRFLPR